MGLSTEDELIYELPREIPTNELLGRKLYLDLKKQFKFLDAAEPEFWNSYTLTYPKHIEISMGDLPNIESFQYNNDKIRRKITMLFKDSITPLELRTIWQHFNREITKCLKRNKKNLKQ